MNPQQLSPLEPSSEASRESLLSLLSFALLQWSGLAFASGQNSFSAALADMSQQNRNMMPLNQIDMNAASAFREFFLNCVMERARDKYTPANFLPQ